MKWTIPVLIDYRLNPNETVLGGRVVEAYPWMGDKRMPEYTAAVFYGPEAERKALEFVERQNEPWGRKDHDALSIFRLQRPASQMESDRPRSPFPPRTAGIAFSAVTRSPG